MICSVILLFLSLPEPKTVYYNSVKKAKYQLIANTHVCLLNDKRT